VILPSLIRGKKARELFIARAQISQSLRHDAIVSVFDIREDREKDIFFFTMEFLEGENLAEYLESKGGSLKFAEACDIVLQLCEALSYAHEKGVVHRDIKPQNIFILTDGNVKILDFGFAKLLSPGRLACSSMGLGTAYYMAPEQSMGKEVDARTDIFSLGAVFYRILAGQVPMGIFKPPSAINSEIPDSINQVISKCLQQNPEDRYHDAVSMAEDIKEVQKGIEPVVREKVSERNKEDKSKKEREGKGINRLALTITVAALLFISGIYLLISAKNRLEIPSVSDSGQLNETPEMDRSLVPEPDISSAFYRSQKVEEISSNSEAERLITAPEITNPLMHEVKISSVPAPIQKDDEISLLLVKAEERMRVHKYTFPKNDNAFNLLNIILKKDAGNEQAKNMIHQIRDIYIGYGERAYNKKDYQKAKEYYEKAILVSPEDQDAQIRLNRSIELLRQAEDKEETIRSSRSIVPLSSATGPTDSLCGEDSLCQSLKGKEFDFIRYSHAESGLVVLYDKNRVGGITPWVSKHSYEEGTGSVEDAINFIVVRTEHSGFRITKGIKSVGSLKSEVVDGLYVVEPEYEVTGDLRAPDYRFVDKGGEIILFIRTLDMGSGD